MNHSILMENEAKRQKQPLWMLLCFSMFCFWQMGFIYFMSPSLTLNGRTPLPISTDNITTLIAVSYVLSVIWMIFLPHYIIRTARISTLTALVTVLGLFLPLSENLLLFLIYTHVFSCCFMIGFETFIMINYFSENSTLIHLTAAYSLALLLIAIVQNDFIPITFPVFRFITVIAVTLLLVFFFRLPGNPNACPWFVKKSDGIPAPKKLLLGTYILVFVSALMAVSGPAISGEITHGVFITYLADALASFTIYVLYKKIGFHPFHSISICIGLGCIGFLLMYVSIYAPVLAYVACALIGFGMIPCQMLPFYGSLLMKSYPSKALSPVIIILALAAVLVQSNLVELFRTAPTLLNLIYTVIMVILAILYLQVEPLFLYTLRYKHYGDNFRKNTTDDSTNSISHNAPPNTISLPLAEDGENILAKTSNIEIVPILSQEETIPQTTEQNLQTLTQPLDVLTQREREVVNLICLGFSNKDIAKMLFISEHTVKDHTKKIYPKLGVHSRFELATLVNRQKEKTEH